MIAGLICLTLFACSLLRYRLFQERATATSFAPASSLTVDSPVALPVIGQLTVRRLGLSVALVEGDDEQHLAVAAGHMPGTAMAGQRGNVVIAGHRDTAFWPLRYIRPGDLINVKTNARSTYRVLTTRVVDPDETAALADTDASVLTLVTCYPFRYVGSAPKRFIVRATLVQ